MHQRLQLFTPLCTDKGMEFIDHQIVEGLKNGGHIRPVAHKQGLQRFGGDNEDAPGLLQEPFFTSGINIPMPGSHRHIQRFPKSRQSPKLVVDQGFQGADAQGANACPRCFHEAGENWQEGSFSFTPCRCCGDNDILLSLQDGRNCLLLNGAQRRPLLLPDPFLDPRMQPQKP